MKDEFGSGFLLGAVMAVILCIFASAVIASCATSSERATNAALLASCEQTPKLGAECRLVAPHTCRTDGNVMTCAVDSHEQQRAETP